MHELNDSRLRSSDFRFSIKRLFIATTASAILLAINVALVPGVPNWCLVIAVVLWALFYDQSEKYMRSAQRALQEDDIPEALQFLNLAIEAKVDDPTRYFARGQVHYMGDDLPAALADLNTAIELESTCQGFFHFRGCTNLALCNFADARADFDQALVQTPNNREAQLGRSVARFKLGDHAAAFSEIEELVAKAPEFGEAVSTWAWFLATCPNDTLRDGERALSLAKQARNMTEEQSWAINSSFSAAYAELGRFDEAIEHAKTALELSPICRRRDLEARLKTVQAHQPLRDGLPELPQ